MNVSIAQRIRRAMAGAALGAMMNWVARKDGSVSFFRNASVARPSVMSAEASTQCAALLAEGLRPSVVARRVGIQVSTLRKAIKR